MLQQFLTFKWTISRGKNTYGYNICSLYVNGNKVSSCNGGGYDMEGSCLGDWIQKSFPETLKILDISKYYGLMDYDGKIIVDGACGFSSMESILNGLGFKLTRVEQRKNTRNQTRYLLTKYN